jgi:hypothetical protein
MNFSPQTAFRTAFFCFLIMVESRCNLVHALDRSIMIDLP